MENKKELYLQAKALKEALLAEVKDYEKIVDELGKTKISTLSRSTQFNREPMDYIVYITQSCKAKSEIWNEILEKEFSRDPDFILQHQTLIKGGTLRDDHEIYMAGKKYLAAKLAHSKAVADISKVSKLIDIYAKEEKFEAEREQAFNSIMDLVKKKKGK